MPKYSIEEKLTHWQKYGKKHKSEINRSIRAYIIDLKSKHHARIAGTYFTPCRWILTMSMERKNLT